MKIRVAFLTISLAACASTSSAPPAATPQPSARQVVAPPPPSPTPALQPVGTYSFTTEFGGNAISGTLVITNTGGTWGGRLTSDAIPEIPVTGVTVEGQVMKVTVESPNGSVVITMTFTGRDYTGSYDLGGITAAVTGTKLS